MHNQNYLGFLISAQPTQHPKNMKRRHWTNPVFKKTLFCSLTPNHKKQHTHNPERCGTKGGWSLLSLWPVSPQSSGICLLPGRHHSHMGSGAILITHQLASCSLQSDSWLWACCLYSPLPSSLTDAHHNLMPEWRGTFAVSLLVRESPSHTGLWDWVQALCHQPSPCPAASQSLLCTAHGTCGSSQGPRDSRCLPVSDTEGCGGQWSGQKQICWFSSNNIWKWMQPFWLHHRPQGSAQMGLGQKRGERAGVRS